MILRALLVCALLGGSFAARAQDIEPRAYSNAPVGVNFLLAGYLYTRGGLIFDSATGITDPKMTTSSPVLAYARVLDLWGMSAKFDAIVPYTSLSGTALRNGEVVTRDVDGFVDPRFRLSVNFYGAPALGLKEFRNYRQDLIVGASLQVQAPWGQYDPDRLVNIGNNRWSFKPELGVSKALGAWTLEGKLGATIFTDNRDFFGGQRRAQDPIWSAQGNLIYGFANGVWASLDATYFTGGRNTIDGERGNDLQQNWRIGTTVAIPINAWHSIKFNASSGVSARTGNNFDLVGVAWQYRWGGGL
jgi:hypothetical protein